MGFAVKTHCSLYFEIPQNHILYTHKPRFERNKCCKERQRAQQREQHREERERDKEP
jgi:hypothetical protein